MQQPKPKKPPIKGYEDNLDSFLGGPIAKARKLSSQNLSPNEDPIDNLRHAAAGMYTTEKYGSITANALGAGYELYKLPQNVKHEGLGNALMSTAEDLFNNYVGSQVGRLPVPTSYKEGILKGLSYNNLLPDGVSIPKGNMYFKKYGGEMNKYNNGGLIEFNGASHEQGGIKMPFGEVEDGETLDPKGQYIFPNIKLYKDPANPKLGKDSKTAAQLSEEVERIYKKRKGDKISEESKQRQLDALKQRVENDPGILKGRAKEEKNKFTYGGFPTVDTRTMLDYLGSQDYNMYQDPVAPANDGYYGGYSPNRRSPHAKGNQQFTTPVEGGQVRTASQVLGQPVPVDKKNFPQNSGLDFSNLAGTAAGLATKVSPLGMGLNMIGPAAQLIGTLAGGKPDPVNFERVKLPTVDYDPLLNTTERQANIARGNIRADIRKNAQTSGNAIINSIGAEAFIAGDTADRVNQIQMNERNQNAQIKGQQNQMNTQIGNQEQIARQQQRAAYRDAIYGSLTDLGNIGAGYLRDVNMANAQDVNNTRTLNMLNSLGLRYMFDPMMNQHVNG
jgi:hypothetical protein